MEFYKACAALLGKDAESWNCKSTGASRHVRSCTLPKIGILNSDDLGNIDARIGPMRFDRVHPQQSWTIAICALLDCRDVDGITASLLFMVDVVVNLKPSELRRAGADFKVAIREKREAYPNIFVREGELRSSTKIRRDTASVKCQTTYVFHSLGVATLPKTCPVCRIICSWFSSSCPAYRSQVPLW